MYIDFHCHRAKNSSDTVCLRNVFAGELDSLPEAAGNVFFSGGIHPYHSAISIAEQTQLVRHLECAAAAGKLAAIGESGLDRLNGAALERQMDIFIRQQKIAEKYKLPLVIHCVRAFPELFHLIKKNNLNCSKWLLHACPGNSDIIRELIKRNIKLSLAPRFFTQEISAESISLLKDYGFGFETDDSEFNIKQCYEKGAELFDSPVSELKQQCSALFSDLFTDVS